MTAKGKREEMKGTRGKGQAMTKHIEDVQELFAIEKARFDKGYKTGFFHSRRDAKQSAIADDHGCGCLGAGLVKIDWYVTRTKERKPIIRVKWFFPKKTRRKVFDNLGYYSYKNVWACVEQQEMFPFSDSGLDAAIKFAEML